MLSYLTFALHTRTDIVFGYVEPGLDTHKFAVLDQSSLNVESMEQASHYFSPALKSCLENDQGLILYIITIFNSSSFLLVKPLFRCKKPFQPPPILETSKSVEGLTVCDTIQTIKN